MSHEPEDLMTPEDEAEIHRAAIRGKVADDLEVIGRMVEQMKAHPDQVDTETHEAMSQAIELYKVYMKQQGIGLLQPDVD